MNENTAGPINWNTHEGKKKIFKNIMQYLHDKPKEEYDRCLDYQFGREIVVTACKTMGDSLEIPSNVRVLFLPDKDNLLGDIGPLRGETPDLASQSPPQAERFIRCGGIPYRAGSSLIITLPPLDDIKANPDAKELLDYACSYIIW